MTVQLSINVPSLKTQQEGMDFCKKAISNLVESPLNDEYVIHRVTFSVPKDKVK